MDREQCFHRFYFYDDQAIHEQVDAQFCVRGCAIVNDRQTHLTLWLVTTLVKLVHKTVFVSAVGKNINGRMS